MLARTLNAKTEKEIYMQGYTNWFTRIALLICGLFILGTGTGILR